MYLKKHLTLLFTLSYFSAFTQITNDGIPARGTDIHKHPLEKTPSVNDAPKISNFHQRVILGTVFPLRIHLGYELQWRGIQLGAFVGAMPTQYQNLTFELLQKFKSNYQRELAYLQVATQSKMQYGAELKLHLGRGFSIGGGMQVFNYTLTDTPKKITEGLLPEEAATIYATVQPSADAKSAYETKDVEAYMNTTIAGPMIEKLFWLNPKKSLFLRFKASYWLLVTRENDLSTQQFSAVEQLGVQTFRPRFLDKIDKVSSQLQAPSFGVEMGIAF